MLKDNTQFCYSVTRILLLIPFLIFGVGVAYAEPLEYVQTSIIDYDGSHATLQLNWNDDVMVEKYEIGCVSCIPNTVYFSTENNLTMKNVSAFPNNSNAMLYIIAYDSTDEIVGAQQILVDINN